MKSWSTGPKNVIRTELMKQSRKKSGPAKTALMIPSHTCLCVEEALKQGVIDKNTLILAIEKDPEISLAMVDKLVQLGVNYQLIHKDLCNIRDFSEYGVDVFDFVYLDTCCHLSPRMQEWIENVLPTCTNIHSQVAFTFINSDRGNWYNSTPDCEYRFSKISKTNTNSQRVAYRIKRLIPSRVKWGRAYKNGVDDAPMISLLMGRRRYADKKETGSTKTYDLGYV